MNLALVSVTMNTPLKREEEDIWVAWYRKMFGDDVYLVSNVSHTDQYPRQDKHPGVNHSEQFDNPGHIPGCCIGLEMGLEHLRQRGFQGNVVLTVPDTIADEGFADILTADLEKEVYGHDWGPPSVATDFILLRHDVWDTFKLPRLYRNTDAGNPIMIDECGHTFIARDRSPALEQWNRLYLNRKKYNYEVFEQKKDGAGWGTNVGTWFRIPGCEFRVVQSGGDARPTKTHTTDKYHEFDIR